MTNPANNSPTGAIGRDKAMALTTLFDTYALKDQKAYYKNMMDRSDKAANQVNYLRASFSFVTGAASIITALIITSSLNERPNETLLGILLVISVIAPAIGGAFGTLADLYQWDRLATIYKSASESIEVADALSPIDEEDDDGYISGMMAFAAGTLLVMRDETGQWGALIRTPEQVQNFVNEQTRRANEISVPIQQRKDQLFGTAGQQAAAVAVGSSYQPPAPFPSPASDEQPATTPMGFTTPPNPADYRQPSQPPAQNIPPTDASAAPVNPVDPSAPSNPPPTDPIDPEA